MSTALSTGAENYKKREKTVKPHGEEGEEQGDFEE